MKHQKWHDGIKKYCAKLIKDFKNKVVPVKWRERSILLSEGFAFCVISEMRQADVIIESGIYNGRSTEIWAKYFKDKKIIVIDKAIDWKKIEHLKKYSNIEYNEGDSLLLIPKIIHMYPNNRISVFLDGPKGLPAMELAKSIFPLNQVVSIGIHDVNKAREHRGHYEKWQKMKFFTDVGWFIDNYAYLDKDESQWDANQSMKWTPYKYVNKDGGVVRNLKSYGPTIGFAL